MSAWNSWDVAGYRIISTVGRGAQSTIYKVADERTGDLYALKRVVRRGPGDDRFVEQAEIEYIVSSRLHHQNLRQSLDIRRVRRWLKLREVLVFMEYVAGETLEKNGPQDLLSLIDVFVGIANGLDAMHQAGFVHCDTKPNNIMIPTAAATCAKLIDFGQSCPIGHRKARIQGTPEYIAPEQVDRLPVDTRTDVFNLGATLYWALTKQTVPTAMLHRPEDAGQLMGSREFVTPEEADPDVPTGLSKLVMECCRKKRVRRPATMAEVISRLEVARHILERNGAGGTPPTPPHDGSARQARRAT